MIKKGYTSFKDLCAKNNVSVSSIYRYLKANPQVKNLSDEEKMHKFKEHINSKPESLNSQCIKMGITPCLVFAFRKRHPELDGLSNDEIIQSYLDMQSEDILKRKLDAQGITAGAFYNYKRRYYPNVELSDDELLEKYLIFRDSRERSTASIAEEYGISTATILKYRRTCEDVKDKTTEEIAQYIVEKRKIAGEPLAVTCKRLGYDHNFYIRVHSYKKNHRDIGAKTNEEYIELYKKSLADRPSETLVDVCKRYKLSLSSVRNFRFKYKDNLVGLSSEEIVKKYIEHTNKPSLKDLCDKEGLVYFTVVDYRRMHPEYKDLEPEKLVEIYKKGKEKNFGKQDHSKLKEWCKKYKIPIERARGYQKYNKCSDIQTILHYKPYLKVNVFGEIVDEEG